MSQEQFNLLFAVICEFDLGEILWQGFTPNNFLRIDCWHTG